MIVRMSDSWGCFILFTTNVGLKAEWCRSRARAARWAEEQDLVLEEMRRVLSYLDWQAQWWRGQSHLRAATVSTELLDGLSAYAAKQSSMFLGLRKRFADQWYPILQSFHLEATWFLDEALGLRPATTVAAPRHFANIHINNTD